MSKAAYLKTRVRALRTIIDDPATSPADRDWAGHVLQGYDLEIARRTTLHTKRKARAERVARAKAKTEAKAARKAARLAKAEAKLERASRPRRLRGRPRTKATRVWRDADGNWKASWPLPYGAEYVSTHAAGLTRRQVRSSRPEVVVRAWRDPKFIPTTPPENEFPLADLATSGAPLPRQFQCLLNSQHHVTLERFKAECQRLVVVCIEELRLDVARRVLRVLERKVHPKPSGLKADPSATTKPTSPVAAVTLPVTPTPAPNPPPSDPLTEVVWFASNEHPYYENSPLNVSHLSRWVTVRNLPFTSANMAKAFSELTASGALTPRATPLAAPTVAPSVQPEVSQHCAQARPQKPNLDVAREDELHRAQVLAGSRTATVSELKRWSEDRHQSLNNILRLERMLRSAEQAER